MTHRVCAVSHFLYELIIAYGEDYLADVFAAFEYGVSVLGAFDGKNLVYQVVLDLVLYFSHTVISLKSSKIL